MVTVSVCNRIFEPSCSTTRRRMTSTFEASHRIGHAAEGPTYGEFSGAFFTDRRQACWLRNRH